MRRWSRGLLALAVLICTHGAFADFVAREYRDGIYIAVFGRGSWTRGGVLDTERKNEKKLLRSIHAYCLAVGKSHVKFPTLEEVRSDRLLSKAWELAGGDVEVRYQFSERGKAASAYRVREVFVLSDTEGPGFEKCSAGKGDVEKARKQLAEKQAP